MFDMDYLLDETAAHPSTRVLPSFSMESPTRLPEAQELELSDRFEDELSSNLDEALEWICRNCNSYERMDAVVYLHGQMDFSLWLALLGDVWVTCDNIGHYKDDLIEILKEWHDMPTSAIPELMTAQERAAFEELPDQVSSLPDIFLSSPSGRGGVTLVTVFGPFYSIQAIMILHDPVWSKWNEARSRSGWNAFLL